MSHRYHIYKENKEKIVRNSPLLHHGHCPQPKEFVEIVKSVMQKDARRHQKKPHSQLEQYPKKANKTKHNELSICLYSINQFYLIQEKNYFKKIYLTKKQKIKRCWIIQPNKKK